MRLFHGSTEIVQFPTILDTQCLLDFGKGFYTTTNKDQAEKWALIKRNRLSIDVKSYVSEYELDDCFLQDGRYKVIVFNLANEEWLDFVVNKRKEDKYLTPSPLWRGLG